MATNKKASTGTKQVRARTATGQFAPRVSSGERCAAVRSEEAGARSEGNTPIPGSTPDAAPGTKAERAGQEPGAAKGQAKAGSKKKQARSKQPDLRKLRDALLAAIAERGQNVMEAVIKEAEKGNYLPAKYLFEFAGIAHPLPEEDAEGEQRARGLAEILLEQSEKLQQGA